MNKKLKYLKFKLKKQKKENANKSKCMIRCSKLLKVTMVLIKVPASVAIVYNIHV